jgi:hypothetical protein
MGNKKRPEIKPVQPSKIEPVLPDISLFPEEDQPFFPPESVPAPRTPEIQPYKEKEEDDTDT